MAFSSPQSLTRTPMSVEELRAIGLAISRDFAPRRFRAGAVRLASPGFSPQELLNISQQITREFAPRALERTGRSKVVALPVDPAHLHVYWQLDEPLPQPAPPASATATEETQPLTLRVFNQVESNKALFAPAETEPAWFDVPVAAERSQQQIVLPTGRACVAGLYQVAIGRLNESQEFNALAYSNATATMPPISTVNERLSPIIAQFIMPPSQASSALIVTASAQQN